ncbi:hypothetical protein [Pseudomonas sp. B22129]|uniref:hypothetical protein n=1 Tax=Pseudomonas sp. B22129 TaxID=3235111 RepID=UPI0037838972
MQSLTSVAGSAHSVYGPVNEYSIDTRHPPTPREDLDLAAPTTAAPPAVVPDDEVPMRFVQEISSAKTGGDNDAFMRGYKNPSAVTLPGYFKTMSDTALMRLAVDQKLSPEQAGALKFVVESRLIKPSLETIRAFTKVITENGVKVTPMPQGFYLEVINQLTAGQCSGITHLMSLAIAEGKEHIFLGNVFQALANPDAVESRLFFNRLAQVQRQTSDPAIAHDPATVKMAPYTSIAPDLIGSSTTKTLLISAYKHRLSAGVVVDPAGKRTYYYNDPNLGFVTFSSPELFQNGLKRIFTHSDLSSLIKPNNLDPKNPMFKMSVFDPEYISAVSGRLNIIKYMYSASLAGMDDIKVVDATRVPTPERFRVQGPAPSDVELAKYDSVLNELGKFHEAKGMSQFHKAVDALRATRHFMDSHPDSAAFFRMLALELKLIAAINEARPPVDYPFAFERIEQQRAYIAEGKLGPKRVEYGKKIQGEGFLIFHPAKTRGRTVNSVYDAISQALLNLQQNDPKAAGSVGKMTNVIIARPGDQPETHLLLGRPPTLIIGDDFFTPPPASGGTVADRLGREAQSNGDNPLAVKQAAMLGGKFGMLAYYKADSTGFLEVASNRLPYQGAGKELGSRATRSVSDFMEEAYTARLYDGKLDAATSASLGRLFAPAADPSPPVAQAPSKQPPPVAATPPAPTLAPIDEAEVQRLQGLDDAGPRIRIGEVDVTRVELYRMGLHVNGKPIVSALATDARGLITTEVEIDYDRLLAYLKSTPTKVGARTTGIVSEIAAKRSYATSPLITRRDGGPVPESLQISIDETSRQAAALRILEHSGKPLPADLFSPPTPRKPAGGTNAGGLGFQAFSTFQGLRASIDALSRGETTAGAIGLGAVAADYAGMGVEGGLNHLAKKAMSEMASPILSFKASSVGKLLGKASGTLGAVVSVPFDIYSAADSFKKAQNSKGKEAQDHYVSAGFSVASAATSLGLTAAFLMGAGSAGPAGLVVAGVLMAAQAIYSAVRTVEDINEYTPLSSGQKFSMGLKSFLGFEPGFDVIKPYLEAKYSDEYDTQQRARHQAFLNGPGKDQFERVVFGKGEVEVTQVKGEVGLTPALWWNIPSLLLSLIKVEGDVPSVAIRGGNDRINAPSDSWNGMSVPPVEGNAGEGKATLWDLGDGDDNVAGSLAKPNYFLLGGGKKLMSGGDADDTVVFNADARQTVQQLEQFHNDMARGITKVPIELWGGEGRNTLMFNGELSTSRTEGHTTRDYTYSGHRIDFRNGTIGVTKKDSKAQGAELLARFDSFSNASTVKGGESYIVGNDQSNLFTLNGHKDVVLTGKGSNVIVINGGASVVGQGGFNTYIINKSSQEVTINDPNNSAIRLDYSAAQVRGWSVSSSGDLSVDLKDEKPEEARKLVIKNAFPNGSQDDNARPQFITNDGVLMTVSAPQLTGSLTRLPQVKSLKMDTVNPKS